MTGFLMFAAIWGFLYIMFIGKTSRPYSSSGMNSKQAAGCATAMIVALLVIGAASSLID